MLICSAATSAAKHAWALWKGERTLGVEPLPIPRTSAPSDRLQSLALSTLTLTLIDAQGKGECCSNDYNCRGGQCTSSIGNGRWDARCLGGGTWANPSGTGTTGDRDTLTGARIMHPTCWAEATPVALEAQLKACETWDARPQTKGTPCEATINGQPNLALGACDLNLQNYNSCFGSVRAPPPPPSPACMPRSPMESRASPARTPTPSPSVAQIGETCKEYKDCAQEVDDRTPWGTDETPDRPVKLTCGRDLSFQTGVLRTGADTAATSVVDVRCAFGAFNSACSLDPTSLVDCKGFDAIPADTKPSGMCVSNCEALKSCRCMVK